MAYHDDLLRQARELARKDRGRPRQVNLRRAVSSAYYAAFHLLSDEGAATLSPSQPEPAAAQVRRAFNHQDMRVICANFSVWNRKHDHPKNGLPAWALRLLTFPLNSSLVSVCDLFVDLQAARHTADYDVSYNWSRSEALENVDDAGQIFAEWRKVRKQPNNPRRVRYRVWV